MCQCIFSFSNYHLTGHLTPHTFPHPHSVFTTAVRHTLSPPPALQSADNRESLHKEIFRIYSPTSFSSRPFCPLLSPRHVLLNSKYRGAGGDGGINVKFVYIMLYQVISYMWQSLYSDCRLYSVQYTIWIWDDVAGQHSHCTTVTIIMLTIRGMLGLPHLSN